MILFRKPFETDEYGVINPENVVKIENNVVKNESDVVNNESGVVKKLRVKDIRSIILDIFKKNNCVTAKEFLQMENGLYN